MWCLLLPLLALVTAQPKDINLSDLSLLLQYEVLAMFYDKTGGESWTDSSQWLNGQEVCVWKGITCYPDDDEARAGHVERIDLPDNHLVGSLPSEIFSLPYLSTLVLKENADLIVSFNQIDGALSLQHLNLDNTVVSSLEYLEGANATLESLRINNVRLEGSLPDELYQLTVLTGLYANSNSISGTLSTLLGQMTSLRQLFLYGSNLSGTIPTEIGLLTDLQILTLTENAFTGTLPTELNQCTSLERLAIERMLDDSFKSQGISGTLPSLNAMPELTEVYLQNQALTGSIPSDFLAASPKDEIIQLDLSGNHITGSVPSSLGQFALLRPLLQDTWIDDVECTDDMSQWLDGDVGTLGCSALLCPPGTWASQGRQTATEECQACDSSVFYGSRICLGAWLYAVNNDTVTLLRNESEILPLLYQQMGGEDWINQDGWLSKSISVCDWYGIECNNEEMVTTIDLRNNGLLNSLPSEIFALPKLKKLKLDSNNIKVSFIGTSRATELEVLDLTFTGLSSLDHIDELKDTNIRQLKLSSNHLTGALPTEIFSLTSLTELSLSHNMLTGPIPTLVGLLNNLERLQLFGNGLSGSLPTELGKLVKAIQVDLSENAFTGSLPTELEKLTSLKSLYLHQTSSDANIVGPLLAFAASTELTSLRLEYNQLTGTLPPNFLGNTDRGDSRIEIILSENELGGVVPSEWADRFDDLFVDLTGNRFVGIHGSWCSKEDWMDGGVSEFGCDSILCPAGKWNSFGRRTDSSNVCRDCPEGLNLLGVRQCGSDKQDGDDILSMLKEFYYATGGASWSVNAGWIQSFDFCNDWWGISCNDYGEIEKIDLKKNSLTGTLPTSLFTLNSLKELHLDANQIYVSFQGIEQTFGLETLSINEVHLDSLDGIGNAINLRNLFASSNGLTGTISEEYFGLTNLSILSLRDNLISGRLPSSISKLTNLSELFLEKNRITGHIPVVIAQLKQLTTLSLSENDLSGTLPEELNEMINLEKLLLQREGGITRVQSSDNGGGQLRSGIRGPLLSFRDLPNLRILLLAGNSLTGSIPFDFLDGIVDKSSAIAVDLSSNYLEGTLPASLSQFDAMDIYVSDNRVTSIAHGLCLKEKWMTGQVQAHGCDAILCPPETFNALGYAITYSDNNTISCIHCLVEGAASYYGSRQCESADAGVERNILREFFFSTRGYDWEVNTNWLDESVSICSWLGVTCVSNEIESISSLILPSYGLQGTLPASLFSLKNLTQIDFSNNKVAVNFTIVQAPSVVEYINLDNTDLSSLDGLPEAAPRLQFLHINDNSFLEVPQELLALTRLQALYASKNDFTGVLPTDFQSLTNLVSFECDDCHLEGSIPDWIGSLSLLEYLSLSQNRMTGTLPVSLESLPHLKYFDMSHQTWRGNPGLSGKLIEFSGMTQLTGIFLSRNALTGSIPESFLRGINASGEMLTVDLASNLLTGSIPTSLARFDDVHFLVGDNKVESVPKEICDLTWNDASQALRDCSHILCPKGTYSSTGYALCEPCSEANAADYLGSIRCGVDLERDILLELFDYLSGPDWNQADNWLQEGTICTWFGITCFSEGDNVGHIKKISLPENNLVGDVPSSIFNLEYLESLELNGNEITLSLEAIGNAQSLTELYLSETPVTSLTGVSDSKLVYLHLTSCNMTGTVPSELFKVTTLHGLYLNYNFFEGTLSTEVGKLTDLREFYLFNNDISGSLPSEIGMLSHINVLGLGENKLTGELPTELSLLTSLKILSLQQEQSLSNPGPLVFEGSVTSGLTGTLLPFDNHRDLTELYLGKNSFEGTIPNSFLAGVSDLTRPIKIDLTNNRLQGSIPAELTRFDDLRLYLAGNRIDNVPSEICNKYSWMGGLMSSGCDALLCNPGFFSEYGRRVSDNYPCQPCTFNISSLFYGSESCEAREGDDLDERAILFQIYRSLDGNEWTKRDNWLEDSKPICSWYGVRCAASKETVVSLELPENGLKGAIPESVYHLSSLKVLNVRDNDVYLTFHSAEVSTSLEELYLERTSMVSLNGVGRIAPLKILHASNNDFGEADLPEDLYFLSNLEDLDLSDSGFSGPLSSDVGKLTMLTELYLHGNDLTGTLPSTLGRLTKLQVLQLSENLFGGYLPTEMNHMTSLKSLFVDAFMNNGAGISGPLPSFKRMPDLRDIYFSSNTLTGSIPSDFLAGITNTDEVITVSLSHNRLTGTLPASLSRFRRLNIDVTDNYFSAIDGTLCAKRDWMDGAVRDFNCEAIMCLPGTFNENGRQTSTADPCIPCTGDDGTVDKYLGRSSCLSFQKEQERQILELFFQVTVGENWKQNDGWMVDNDICNWYGVTCRGDRTVESIILGSNNLQGRLPKEIFQLSNLHMLWLYSNPIEVSLEGLEKAKALASLQLDSTNLESLRGIGSAPVLSDVDVRFCGLSGSIPIEIRHLRELKSFSAGNNKLTGTVPTFSSNYKLTSLRLGSNLFTGTLPDFGSHEELTTLDLSENQITGTIPASLLEAVDPAKKTVIDLSANELTGTVPGALVSNFQELTIYLRDNYLVGIDGHVCEAELYNGGDVGIYGCDAILCPVGKFNPGSGRASQDDGACLPCPEAKYLGASICGRASSAVKTRSLLAVAFGFIGLALYLM
jgi:Leucine-rich repeat (LRR) protein